MQISSRSSERKKGRELRVSAESNQLDCRNRDRGKSPPTLRPLAAAIGFEQKLHAYLPFPFHVLAEMPCPVAGSA